MLILVFSGVIALAELYALGRYDARRNRRPLTYLERQNYWYREYLREEAARQMASPFPIPTQVSSRATLDMLSLLNNCRSTRDMADLAGRVM